MLKSYRNNFRNIFSGNSGKTAGRKSVPMLLMTLLAVLVFPYFSCEVSVEEPIVVTTFPLESGGIIYGNWTPIKIGFSDTMVPADAAYLAEAVNVWDHNHVAVSGSVTWEDNTIYFSPLEKWKTGEKYLCRINGTFSAQDGRVVGIKNELVFFVVADIETVPPVPPEVTEVFFLIKNDIGDYEDLAYDADEYGNNAITGECGLRILFDQEMDLSEPKKSLRMEPYRDYVVKVADNKTLEVYFKAESEPVKKVSFTVKADIHSIAGDELEQDYTFYFTDWVSDLEVTRILVWESVEFDENEDYGLDVYQQDSLFLAGAEVFEDMLITEFTFRFNRPVNPDTATSLLSKIVLVPADERIKKAPSLVEIGLFEPSYDQTWGGMEFDSQENSPYCYLVKIPGGIDGISDGYGHYLIEDMTVKLHVVDWKLIDPHEALG
jgi:hypothetical protein